MASGKYGQGYYKDGVDDGSDEGKTALEEWNRRKAEKGVRAGICSSLRASVKVPSSAKRRDEKQKARREARQKEEGRESLLEGRCRRNGRRRPDVLCVRKEVMAAGEVPIAAPAYRGIVKMQSRIRGAAARRRVASMRSSAPAPVVATPPEARPAEASRAALLRCESSAQRRWSRSSASRACFGAS